MNQLIHLTNVEAGPAGAATPAHGLESGRAPAVKIAGKVFKRALLVLAVIGLAGTSSGCLWVRDDQGHHHWRWHHEDNHDVDHHNDDHP